MSVWFHSAFCLFHYHLYVMQTQSHHALMFAALPVVVVALYHVSEELSSHTVEAVIVFGEHVDYVHMEEYMHVCATQLNSNRLPDDEHSLSHHLIFGYVDLSLCESFVLAWNVYWKYLGNVNDSHMEYSKLGDTLACKGGHFGNKCHLDEGILKEKSQIYMIK